MKGVIVKKAKLVSDDERRTIHEIINGEMSIKNFKILTVKKGQQVLGNHWHPYAEVMFVVKGKADYIMKNIDTNETETYELEEGDVVFRTGRITHSGVFEEGSIILDGACEPYLSADFNDVMEKLI